jgi:DNA adenine methylase
LRAHLGRSRIFFAKAPSKVEIINNTNGELIIFYQVAKCDFSALEREIGLSLHSHRQHQHAWIIYNNPELFDPIKRAWAVWMLANTSYSYRLNGSFGYDRKGSNSQKLANKQLDFTTEYAERLQ